MKSSQSELKSRGSVSEEDIIKHKDLTKEELLELLKSKEPYKRTVSVRLLSEEEFLNRDMITVMCEMLLTEKKLYTKLEICDVLSKTGLEGTKVMVNYLGIIGNNQYKELPDKEFNKKSYPLPRDIISRILAHMDIEILPELTKVLDSRNVVAIREVIDSIGFICFYNHIANKDYILEKLLECFEKYVDDEIIRWKIVRAMSSFKTERVLEILKTIEDKDGREIIRKEAKKSRIYGKI